MKKAEIVATVRSGPLRIDIRSYADGRFGFETKDRDEDRIRVRCSTIEDAKARATTMLGVATTGKVDPAGIDLALFAEFLAYKESRCRKVLVPDLVTSFLESKKSKGRSEWTLKGLKELEKFAAAFPGYLTDIQRKEVEDWLDAKKVGPRRWNNLLANIKALYRFARRDGCLLAALEPVELIEKRRTTVRIETYTADELKRLLAVIPDEWMPVVVIGAFAGIRPEELCPDPMTQKPGLAWENILWAKGKIDVPRDVAKDRRRRFVPLHESLAAYLEPWRFEKGPIAPRRRLANQTRHWKRKSGVKWKRDGLRHSYASYRLALTKNIHELSLEMGNSVKIIHDFYLDLKHEDEAEEWFGLRPAKSGQNIIPIAGLAQSGTK